MISMLLKNIEDIPAFLAGDATQIKEVLHPKNDAINLPYSIAFGSLESGKSSKPHILHGQVEVYLVLAGEGVAILEGQKHPLKKGDVFLIPEGGNQYISNTSDEVLRFICIVSPPWQEAEEEIL